MAEVMGPRVSLSVEEDEVRAKEMGIRWRGEGEGVRWRWWTEGEGRKRCIVGKRGLKDTIPE